jgi:hypothetical protein
LLVPKVVDRPEVNRRALDLPVATRIDQDVIAPVSLRKLGAFLVGRDFKPAREPIEKGAMNLQIM